AACAQAAAGGRDHGDGAGCLTATRRDPARRLHAWLASDPTGTAPTGAVLLGDFNAYAREDPITWLQGQGWADAFALVAAGRPWSYVFRRQAGRPDHALLDPGLAPRPRRAAAGHAGP